MVTVSVDVGYVDVDVDLEDFEDDDLVEEVKSRGYVVYDEDDDNPFEFTKDEIAALKQLIDQQDPKVGSVFYFIREKLILV